MKAKQWNLVLVPLRLIFSCETATAANRWVLTGVGLAAAFRNLGQNLWGPHRYGSLSDVLVSCVVSGPCSAHSLLITTQGQLWSWGE